MVVGGGTQLTFLTLTSILTLFTFVIYVMVGVVTETGHTKVYTQTGTLPFIVMVNNLSTI